MPNSEKQKKIILELCDVGIAYNDEWILSDLNLEINEEEFISIVGPSGVGKSTLLHGLAGLLPFDRGHARVYGQVENTSSHFSYMQQDDLLLPWLSIFDNVCLYQKVHMGKGQAAFDQKEILRSLERFGLGDYAFALPEQLSGGMRQRAAFLRTVQSPASVLLLDEPFAASDAITRASLQDWLMEIRRDLRRTILLVTHDLDEAIYLSDRIIVLGGRPADVRMEVSPDRPFAERDRDWLYKQGALKSELHAHLTMQV